MKKITLVALLFCVGISYGQTKTKTKENKSKELVNTSGTSEDRITKVKVDSNKDNDLVIPPDNGPSMPNEDDTIIYNPAEIEVKPEFPGGNTRLYDYLSKNFELSDEMRENELKGKILASFIIERDGSITNIKIIKDLDFGSGNQAERVLKKMPRWNPGEQNGKKVRCSYILPITIYATK